MVDKDFISNIIRRYDKEEKLTEFVNDMDNKCKKVLLEMLDKDARKKVIECIELKIV